MEWLLSCINIADSMVKILLRKFWICRLCFFAFFVELLITFKKAFHRVLNSVVVKAKQFYFYLNKSKKDYKRMNIRINENTSC